MILGLRSSLFLHCMISWVAIELNFCFAASKYLGNIWLGWNSIVLLFLVCSSLHLRGRNGSCETRFYFGLDPSSTTPTCLPPWKSVELLRSRCTKSRRWPCHCCLGETTLSIRCWRLGPGVCITLFHPFTFEMSPTGSWIPSPSDLWWQLRGHLSH